MFGQNCYQFQNKQGTQIEYMFPQLVEIEKNKDKGNNGHDMEEIGYQFEED